MLKLAVASSGLLQLTTEITFPLKLTLPDVVLDNEILVALSKPYPLRVLLSNESPYSSTFQKLLANLISKFLSDFLKPII